MIEVDKGDCDFCGACAAVCPVDCIELYEKDIKIDSKKCTECKLCIYICPIEAMSYVEHETV
ncbi:4Fe-4S binding protein [bacterium]|nr:4Fe-4S binding protein [bacterium]